MGRRLLCVILLLWATTAQAQLPYLDDDGSGAAGFGPLPFDSVTSFPDPCDPGFCVAGIVEGTTNEYDCQPCAAVLVATPTAPAATLTPTPTPTLEICPLVGACVTATAPPSLTPTPQLTAAAAPVACRTVNTAVGWLGGIFKDNPAECLPTPDPTATVTSTAAVMTPTYTVPFITPTPQLTAAAAPCTCRTVTTAVGVLGGMFADNPCACVATPAPTTTPAPTATPEPACGIVYVSSGGGLVASGRLCRDLTTGYACMVFGTATTCTPDRALTIINDESTATNTVSGQITLSRASRTGVGGAVGVVRKKSRGSIGAETPPNSGDGIGGDFWQVYCDDGSVTCLGYYNVAGFVAATTENVTSVANLGAVLRLSSVPAGAGALVNTLAVNGGRVGVGPSQTTPTFARFAKQEETIGDPVDCSISTATNDDPRSCLRQQRTTTTNATVTTLWNYTLTASQTVVVIAKVLARRTGGAAGTAEDGAGYVIRATYKTVAGVATLIGAVDASYTAESQAAWNATFSAAVAGGCTANTDICVRVTGAANNNVTWHVHVEVSEVGS